MDTKRIFRRVHDWPDRMGYVLGILGLTLAGLGWLFPGRLLLQGRPEPSVPFHLALRLPAPLTWKAGDLVQFTVRDLRPYYSAGTPFTKIVAAVPGDRLSLAGRTLTVNGVVVATARPTDHTGRPAPLYVPAAGADGTCVTTPPPLVPPRATGCILPPGTLFVLGTHERSFDSRYWGLVLAPEVMGRVLPLL